MNIYANEGHKVIFANPYSGYESQAERTRKVLVEGQIYTVEETIVHQSSTEVFLQEVPNTSFNSVFFEDAPEETTVVGVAFKGCDDSNCFNLRVNDDELTFLKKLSTLSKHHSAYSCQPIVELHDEFVEEVEELLPEGYRL